MSSTQENSPAGNPSSTAASSGLTPEKIIERAQQANPVFKLLWGILAFVAVASIAATMLNYRIALFGGLIVFLLLMVLYVSVGLGDTKASHHGGAAADRSLPALSLFLAWSSAFLMVLVMVALFSSAFLDLPVPLREAIFGPLKEVTGRTRLGIESEDIVLADSQLDEPRKQLEGQEIADAKVRALFIKKTIPVTSVKFQIDRATDNKRIVAIGIWPVFGSYPLHLCDLTEKDSDFSPVKNALELK